MSTVIDYILSVRLQQSINFNFPKQDSLLSNFSLPYTTEQGISFIQNEAYEFLACRFLNKTYYWEFVNSSTATSFEELTFIYIPVSFINFEILKSKIPYYASWDKQSELVLSYPDTEYLIDTDSASWGSFYTTNVSSGFTHPFLFTFEFTGRTSILRDRLLYEYKDVNGYYGPKDLLYLSCLRPQYLDYPLGVPTESQLEDDDCIEDNYLKYPISGDSYYVGNYLGKYTNSTYSNSLTFWLYENSSSTFLLNQPPGFNKKGVALEALGLIGEYPFITLPNLEGLQTIKINQTSVPTELILPIVINQSSINSPIIKLF